jgi:peptidoglycan/LPS O-acetylase OafA/YrhL
MNPDVKSPSSGFRPDINGLRSIAVLLVVFYHFEIPPIRGGFIGVDVFFVISGYLMTQIIISRLKKNAFSVRGFLWDRFSRIVPALTVVCAVLLLVGWTTVEPMTYAEMASASAYSLTFISNIRYFFQGGYFSGANSNWLLHTWSLSVEWQFYILYPVFLLAIWRLFKQQWVLPTIILLTAVSFVICVLLTSLKPMAAFYLLPARAWEMLVGGIVYFCGDSFVARFRRHTRPLELLGIGLLVIAALIFDRDSIWPSFRAAFPVIGAALVMLSNRGEKTLLASPPLQVIGRWSYSIYLFHWPLIVGFRYFHWLDARWSIPVTLVATLILGALSYRYVERPVEIYLRQPTSSFGRLRQSFAPGLVVLCSVWVLLIKGAPWRSADISAVADTIVARNSWAFPQGQCEGFLSSGGLKTCRIGGQEKTGTIVIGDSEAQEWYPRYLSLGDADPKLSVTFATRAGCAPVPEFDRAEPNHKCGRFARAAFDLAEAGHFRSVILIAAWSDYFSPRSAPNAIAICVPKVWGCQIVNDDSSLLDLLTTSLATELARLTTSGKQVSVVLPLPAPGFSLPQVIAQRAFWGDDIGDLGLLSAVAYTARNDRVRKALVNAVKRARALAIDPWTGMCNPTECTLTDEAGHSLFIDSIHLRPSAVQQRFSFLDSAIAH